MTYWEYCILTRLSAGLDTKWFANRIFHHNETELPNEVTDQKYKAYNAAFEKLHAKNVFPVLPAVINLMGADGWELIDDMNTGAPGGEGLVFKRQLPGKPRPAAKKTAAKKAAAKKSAAKKTASRR